MSWTGIATDLTLDDVIGPPRELPPAPQPQLQPRAASVRPAVAPQPEAIRYRAPSAPPTAPTKPQPHVHVTEDMLPPAMRARLPGGRPSRRPGLRGAILLGVVAVMAGMLVWPMLHSHDEAPVPPAAHTYEPSAPVTSAATPAVQADDAAPVSSVTQPKAPARARQAQAPARHKRDASAPAAEPTEQADDVPSDINIEKFRQLSGKI